MNWHSIELWEGPYLDLWSIPHTFYGVAVVLFFVLIKRNLFVSLVCTFVFAIGWEVYESVSRIPEPLSNRITDVIIATIAAMVTAYFFYYKKVSKKVLYTTVAIVTIILVVSNTLGWLAYLQYGV